MIKRLKFIFLISIVVSALMITSVAIYVTVDRMSTATPDTEKSGGEGAEAMPGVNGAGDDHQQPQTVKPPVSTGGSGSSTPIGRLFATGIRSVFSGGMSTGAASVTDINRSAAPFAGFLGGVTDSVGDVFATEAARMERDAIVAAAVEEAKNAALEEYNAKMAVRAAFAEKYGKQASELSDSEIDAKFNSDYFVGRMKELGYYKEKTTNASLRMRDAIIRAQSMANVAITAKLDHTTKRILIENSDLVVHDTVPKNHPKGLWGVLNKSRKILTIYVDGEVFKKYPVAIGRSAALTPTGQWTWVNKSINPPWGGGGYSEPIAGGARSNPLGSRWMGISFKGGGRYGFHGNASPFSIGTNASNGCVRMTTADVEELFEHVTIGNPIWIGTTDQLELWGITQTTKAVEIVMSDYRVFLSPEMAALEIEMLKDYGLYEEVDEPDEDDLGEDGEPEEPKIIDPFNPGRTGAVFVPPPSNSTTSTMETAPPANTGGSGTGDAAADAGDSDEGTGDTGGTGDADSGGSGGSGQSSGGSTGSGGSDTGTSTDAGDSGGDNAGDSGNSDSGAADSGGAANTGDSSDGSSDAGGSDGGSGGSSDGGSDSGTGDSGSGGAGAGGSDSGSGGAGAGGSDGGSGGSGSGGSDSGSGGSGSGASDGGSGGSGGGSGPPPSSGGSDDE